MTAITPTLTVTADTKLTDKQAIARYTELHARDLVGKRAVITNIIHNGNLRTYEFDLRPVASQHGRHEELHRRAVTVAPAEEPAPQSQPEQSKPAQHQSGKPRGQYKTAKPPKQEEARHAREK